MLTFKPFFIFDYRYSENFDKVVICMENVIRKFICIWVCATYVGIKLSDAVLVGILLVRVVTVIWYLILIRTQE